MGRAPSPERPAGCPASGGVGRAAAPDHKVAGAILAQGNKDSFSLPAHPVNWVRSMGPVGVLLVDRLVTKPRSGALSRDRGGR